MADFGNVMFVDESTSMTTTAVGKKQGTIRWMAPELLFPERFEFTDELMNQLPSKDTDIYAIGMTIFEVSACRPARRKHGSYLLTGYNGMRSIRQRSSKRDSYTQSCGRRSARQTIFGALRRAVGPVSGDVGCAIRSETPGKAICLYRTHPIEGVCWGLGEIDCPTHAGRLGKR